MNTRERLQSSIINAACELRDAKWDSGDAAARMESLEIAVDAWRHWLNRRARPRTREPQGYMLLVWRACQAMQRRQWTREDLVVQCWKLFPKEFGLPGFEKLYPNNHRVYTELYGKGRGLIFLGKIRRVKRGWFELVQPEVTHGGVPIAAVSGTQVSGMERRDSA